MAIYHAKFTYKNKQPNDFGLVVGVFSPDSGDVDSFLSMEPTTTESYDGTKLFDYGAKYTDTASLVVSLIKSDNSDITVTEARNVLKWLTGSRAASQLDLYKVNDKIAYSFFGRFTEVNLQKLDSRVVGIIATFTATSPWAYSAVQVVTQAINGSTTLTVANLSDDEDTYVYPEVVFTNENANGTLNIKNTTLSEETIINNIAVNEKITMNSNQIIYSDNPTRIFGNDFNFKWLRLVSGNNSITITGTGSISIQYRYFIKVADALVDIEDTYYLCD